MPTCNNLSSERQAEIEARITQYESMLANAYTAYDSTLLAGGIESSSFDSGEAKQTFKYFDVDKLFKQIERLESRIDSLNRKLNNRSNVILALRRKYRTYYGGTIATNI